MSMVEECFSYTALGRDRCPLVAIIAYNYDDARAKIMEALNIPGKEDWLASWMDGGMDIEINN
ncbi:MAG TPA: hypothetical protein VFF14_01450 [Candidatus Deferrimicrobium sp.]|nr:hypothetical protein [Candidatus Deferrimicrobium sp.]